MANVSIHTITSWYMAATNQHGPSKAAKQMAIGMLEDIASQEVQYARKNERSATEAEEAIAKLVDDEPTE